MKKQKHQLVFIHGGMTFKNKNDYIHYLKTRKVSVEPRKRWSADYLDKSLGKQFNIIKPRMPLQDNAKYDEWKITFERYIPLLENNVTLIGSSLGAMFLAKYLSEHKFPKKIAATYLIAPPYDHTHSDEDLVGGFRFKVNESMLKKNSPNMTLFFSKDDECVPVYHAKKYQDNLPFAKIIVYKSKNGHFNVPQFPELVKLIKQRNYNNYK